MKKWIFGLIAVVVFGAVGIAVFNVSVNQGSQIRVPQDAASIPEALELATASTTIIVDAHYGPYESEILLHKPTIWMKSINGRAQLTSSSEQTTLTILANGVRVSGFEIQGGKCVSLLKVSLVLIEDNVLTDCAVGIELQDSQDNQIVRNTISRNRFGIKIVKSNANTFKKNKVESNYEAGIYGRNSHNNLFQENDIWKNYFGVKLESSQHNRILENNIRENERDGVVLSAAAVNHVEKNMFVTNYNGISLEQGAEENTIVNNRFKKNHYSGIQVKQSNKNVLAMNITEGNVLGIYLVYAKRNLVEQNQAYSNTESGISLRNASLNTIRENQVSVNSRGFDFNSAKDNILLDNYSYNNRVGILINTSDGNKLQGNHTESNDTGLEIHFSNNNLVKENHFLKEAAGILISESTANTFVSNHVTENLYGINLIYSTNNTFLLNLVTDNRKTGLSIINFSSNNLVSQNELSNNEWGLLLSSSFDNEVDLNTLQRNDIGIVLNRSGAGTRIKGNEVIFNNIGINLPEYLSKDNTFLAGTPVILEAVGTDEEYLIRDNLIHNNQTIGLNNEKKTIVYANNNQWGGEGELSSFSESMKMGSVYGRVELEKQRLLGPIFIASESSTEHFILGALLKLVLEANGYAVVDMTNLGDAQIVTKALIAGVIDIAWINTDTALPRYSQSTSELPNDENEILLLLRQKDSETSNLIWLECAPANTALGLAISLSPESAIKSHGFNPAMSEPKTIRDLARLIDTSEARLSIAFPESFSKKEIRGLSEFAQRYGVDLNKLHIKSEDVSQAAIDLSVGNVDIALIRNTAAEISVLDLFVLEDNLNFFWKSNLCPVIREPVAAEFPEMIHHLESVSRLLTLEQLYLLISKVQYLGETPENVAQQFLSTVGIGLN